MKKQGPNPCVIASSEDKYNKNKENGLWVYHRLLEHVPNLRLCIMEDNSVRRSRLIDTDGKLFTPDCIFRYGQRMKPSFEKKIPMINPTIMRYIAMDKIYTAEIVRRKLPNIMVPRTFIIKSSMGLKRKLKENPSLFENGFVIKPNFESLGFGITVCSSPEEEVSITRPCILQQRIVPKKRNGKYWDLRVFAFNGQIMGGEIRSSVHKVTNVAIGGSVEKVPSSIIEKARNPAIQIIRAIDEEAERISKSKRLFKNLRKRTPKTVINK